MPNTVILLWETGYIIPSKAILMLEPINICSVKEFCSGHRMILHVGLPFPAKFFSHQIIILKGSGNNHGLLTVTPRLNDLRYGYVTVWLTQGLCLILAGAKMMYVQ